MKMATFDILPFLIPEEWVSGEEMAKRLAISRAAVWKQVQALRQRGYEISASTRKGYRLAKKPDLLDADLVCGILRTKWLGRDIRIQAEVSSTNVVAPPWLATARTAQSSWPRPRQKAGADSLVFGPRLPVESG